MNALCWAAGFMEGKCEFRPDGRPDPAHIGFTKQRLRSEWRKHALAKKEGRAFMPAILERKRDDFAWDARVVRPVCRRHHQILDGPTFHLWVHQLPKSVLDFADEYDLRHILEEADRRQPSPQKAA